MIRLPFLAARATHPSFADLPGSYCAKLNVVYDLTQKRRGRAKSAALIKLAPTLLYRRSLVIRVYFSLSVVSSSVGPKKVFVCFGLASDQQAALIRAVSGLWRFEVTNYRHALFKFRLRVSHAPHAVAGCVFLKRGTSSRTHGAWRHFAVQPS